MKPALNSRQPIVNEYIPDAEFAAVLGGTLKLSIVADGKHHIVQLTRGRLLALMESGFQALKEQEPGWK